MTKCLSNSCFPIFRKRQATVTLVFFDQGTTKTLNDSKKHVAGEIMFEFPNQIVCHVDSFFIGQYVQSLAMDDYLIPGQTYLVLPIERFSYKILTTSCLSSIFNPNNNNNNSNTNNPSPLSLTAPSSPPPFEYVKGLNGKTMIKVCPEFILSRILCNKRIDNDDDHHDNDDDMIISEICNSPELKKHYDQLVGDRGQLWSPKLKTISEYEIRVSPLRFLGIIRRKEEVKIKFL
ncbi:unnamed protein product [Cochlearia groenlandica]